MKAIMLHLRLIREVRCVPLACVVRHHVKVAHTLHEYVAYLNFNKEMLARVPWLMQCKTYRRVRTG